MVGVEKRYTTLKIQLVKTKKTYFIQLLDKWHAMLYNLKKPAKCDNFDLYLQV